MSAKPLKYIFEGANCPNATGLETFFFHLTKSLYVLLNSLLHFFWYSFSLCVFLFFIQIQRELLCLPGNHCKPNVLPLPLLLPAYRRAL